MFLTRLTSLFLLDHPFLLDNWKLVLDFNYLFHIERFIWLLFDDCLSVSWLCAVKWIKIKCQQNTRLSIAIYRCSSWSLQRRINLLI